MKNLSFLTRQMTAISAGLFLIFISGCTESNSQKNKANLLSEPNQDSFSQPYEKENSPEPALTIPKTMVVRECKVEGILYSENNPSVIIDGTKHHTSDTVYGGTITKISEDKVFIQFGEGFYTIW